MTAAEAYAACEAAERRLHAARDAREAAASWTGYARDADDAARQAAEAAERAVAAEQAALDRFHDALAAYEDALGGTPDGDAVAAYEGRAHEVDA